jgi:hypothetical protein
MRLSTGAVATSSRNRSVSRSTFPRAAARFSRVRSALSRASAFFCAGASHGLAARDPHPASRSALQQMSRKRTIRTG